MTTTTTRRTVTSEYRNANGDRVRMYSDGRGWNATQGRRATEDEKAEAQQVAAERR